MKIYKTHKGYYYKESIVKKKVVRKRISKEVFDKTKKKNKTTKTKKKNIKDKSKDKSKIKRMIGNSMKGKYKKKCKKQKGGTPCSTQDLIDKIKIFYTSQDVPITPPELNTRDLTIQWDSQIQSSGKQSTGSLLAGPYCRYCGIETYKLNKFMLKSFTKTNYKDSDVCDNCIIFLRECLYNILFRSTDYTHDYISEAYNEERELHQIEFISDDDYTKLECLRIDHGIQEITINGFLLYIRLLDDIQKNVIKIIINNYFNIILKITSHNSQKSYFHNYSILNKCLTENQDKFIPFNLLYCKTQVTNKRTIYKVCNMYEYINHPDDYNSITKEHFITLYQQLQLMLDNGILYIDLKYENLIFGHDMSDELKLYLIDFDDIMYKIDSHIDRKNFIIQSLTWRLPINMENGRSGNPYPVLQANEGNLANEPIKANKPKKVNTYDRIENHFFNNKHINDYITFIEYTLKSIYIGIFDTKKTNSKKLLLISPNKIQVFLDWQSSYTRFIRTNENTYKPYETLLNDAPTELNNFKLSKLSANYYTPKSY